MDRIWLAVVTSGILVLMTVVGLLVFVPRDDITAQARSSHSAAGGIDLLLAPASVVVRKAS